MLIKDFLSKQDPARIKILSELHELILHTDPNVEAVLGTMMGNEMIIYNESAVFKYGLASGKNYMTLHNMAIYGSPTLKQRYLNQLKGVKFQKGCINFKTAKDLPLGVVSELMRDSAAVNMKALYDQYRKQSRKTKTTKN